MTHTAPIAAIAVVVLLAGCGGDDEKEPVATAPRQAEPAPGVRSAPETTAPKERAGKERAGKEGVRTEDSPPPKARANADSDVAKAVRRFVTAVGRRDRAALCRHLVSELRRDCERGRSEIVQAFMRSRRGDLAVADATVRGNSGGAKVHLRNHATFIMRAEDGEWRVETYRYPQKGKPVH
jgi:hypothetical protein